MKLHIGWAFTYLFILLPLFGAEMYAIGRNSEYALTNVTTSLVREAPWVAVPVMVFLMWLTVHFGIRLIPILFGREPMTWL